MMEYRCECCGAYLDPGEGRICDECLDELNNQRQRRNEINQMILSVDYKQMEMEEFLNCH